MILSNNLRADINFEVVKIEVDDNEFKHKLGNIGLYKGAIFQVKKYNDKTTTKKAVHVVVLGIEYVLREDDAKSIYIKEV